MCNWPLRPSAASAMLLLTVMFASSLSAQSLRVLHNFGVAAGDGDIPYSSLIMDASGNLYGTTLEGGAHGFGTVYRLSASGGGWKETILYSFKGGTDGASPHAPLIQDSIGNLYGTTIQGGLTSKNCNSTAPATGCGVVFKLTPATQGPWTETVLYSFTGGGDGGNPYSGLVRDRAGNLYGTTVAGGANDMGTVFKLSFPTNVWTETVLHSFTGNSDGNGPYAGVVFDRLGKLYGTTYEGGSAGLGIVYELTPRKLGAWSETILHTFEGQGGNDGAQPLAGVVLDNNGDVFGTTTSGGSSNYGAVFELNASNGYSGTVIHNFDLGAGDGTFPNGVILDTHGNLYGTTSGGGATNGAGTIFEMTPGGSGWTETVLFTFLNTANGVYPDTPLYIDSSGKLYGTTLWGGKSGDTTGGVTFQFTP